MGCKRSSKTRCIGILTSGGDCPGLNAAIRGVARAAMSEFGIKVIGFLDGFRGLVENRCFLLDDKTLSGILTVGGTILGTSRDKLQKMPMGGQKRDMTDVAVDNLRNHQIDCLVCLGGGGTQKNAFHLVQNGVNVVTLPKTIDNDVVGTDVTFGFDTALGIAAEAIDRLHTTATSHHRIIVCEIMGHNAGWLPLGAGIAGGADAILIPEIPYDLDFVGEHLLDRRRQGKRFSIIAVAEGAVAKIEEEQTAKDSGKKNGRKKSKKDKETPDEEAVRPSELPYRTVEESKASRIARELQVRTGVEARVTALGHVQRGGSPSAADRLLCTRLGTKAAELLAEGTYNVMVGVHGDRCEAVPLKQVAGHRKVVPLDHDWVRSALLVETCLGDVVKQG